MARHLLVSSICAIVALLAANPAVADDGQVLITHAKALAGNVTPGDTAGYPVTLSESGSYILGSSLYPGPRLDGIRSADSDTTIDLNGFRISGGPAAGTNNAANGIVGSGDRLTIKNGTIGAFRNAGISAPVVKYLIIKDIRLINNLYGIESGQGFYARIQDSTVASNRSHGIFCGSSCHVSDSVVSGNEHSGIFITSGTVLGNTISGNSIGIRASDDQGVGYGNNTIMQNTRYQVYGLVIKLVPNACVPAC